MSPFVKEKAVVANVEVDFHWDACKRCLHFNTDMDCCEFGIQSEDDGRIAEDWSGVMYCTEFKEGVWRNPEEVLIEAKERGIIFDHPDQKFFCIGMSPSLKDEYVRKQRGLA